LGPIQTSDRSSVYIKKNKVFVDGSGVVDGLSRWIVATICTDNRRSYRNVAFCWYRTIQISGLAIVYNKTARSGKYLYVMIPLIHRLSPSKSIHPDSMLVRPYSLGACSDLSIDSNQPIMSFQISFVYQELPEDCVNEPNSPILTLDRTPLDRITSRFVNDMACLTRREWVLTWMLSATGRLHIPEDLREEYQWVEIEPGFMLRLNAALRYFRGIDCLGTLSFETCQARCS
jgi:hypothetical protein